MQSMVFEYIRNCRRLFKIVKYRRFLCVIHIKQKLISIFQETLTLPSIDVFIIPLSV